ncbi:hypothetical protein T484DRAFT_1851179 [Baffinella frigidus]|nr:hypothetical protein T484DRAFT_1851179 [Cryptophyta sp. CCMP2293]
MDKILVIGGSIARLIIGGSTVAQTIIGGSIARLVAQKQSTNPVLVRSIIGGSIARLVAQTMLHPVDTLRTRRQVRA